jgi:decaprenylphospho-beta-D-ribofuranose 2-oxidase
MIEDVEGSGTRHEEHEGAYDEPAPRQAITLLPVERLRMLHGWAMVQRAAGYVWQPTTVEEIRDVLALAQRTGRTVAPRGAGYSYNDAALNREEIVLDLSRMHRVLAWDALNGVITVEPGVTVRDLWRKVLADCWWPPVVPGTMGPTIGGALAMNVHGKNAWRLGSIGEHILSFDLLSPAGDLVSVTPDADPDLFHAAIGGIGMLGIITSVTLRMRRIVSGLLATRTFAARNLDEMFRLFAEHAPAADYLVGWIDGFAAGVALGRGLVERADFSEEPDSVSLHPGAQDVPPKIAGLVPRAQLWRVMKPLFTDPAMRATNAAQFRRGALTGGHVHYTPHAQFHFLHDYMPNWQRSWLPGGLRQFQAFIPREHAYSICAELLERSHAARLYPYLCVFKQHRSDPFLLRYQLDGFSLSLDYHVTAHNAARLDELFVALRAPVVASGGTFYLAKDDSLDAATYARTVGPERVARFLALKRARDPEGRLQSDLFRRVFGGTAGIGE